MEQVSQLPDLHRKITDWKGEVSTVREELSTLNDHLEKIARHNHLPAVMVQVEHFQNQFICQKEVADQLFHDLKQAAKSFSGNIRNEAYNGKITDAYDHLNDRMQTFNKLFAALKTEFNLFMKKIPDRVH
jgi:hypothetical protein